MAFEEAAFEEAASLGFKEPASLGFEEAATLTFVEAASLAFEEAVAVLVARVSFGGRDDRLKLGCEQLCWDVALCVCLSVPTRGEGCGGVLLRVAVLLARASLGGRDDRLELGCEQVCGHALLRLCSGVTTCGEGCGAVLQRALDGRKPGDWHDKDTIRQRGGEPAHMAKARLAQGYISMRNADGGVSRLELADGVVNGI